MKLAVIAYPTFFVAPLILWLIATGLTPREGDRRFLSVISGHDGRLSLSRLQATIWTLIIFGAWCAAMISHWPFILTVSSAERQARETAAKEASANLYTLRTASRQAWDAAAKNDLTAAKKASEEAEAAKKAATAKMAEAKAAIDKAVADHDKAAEQLHRTELTQTTEAEQKANATAAAAAVRLTEAEKAVANRDKADDQLSEAEEKIADLHEISWVRIPPELLLLAGISLASGVFASVISAAGDAKTGAPPTRPSVTQMTQQAAGTGLPAGVTPIVPLNGRPWIKIDGIGLGTSGSVRIGAKPQQLAYWAADGRSIGAIGTEPPKPYSLIVDTNNGKVAYNVAAGGLEPVIRYEWGDLFRDDTDPQVFSLMKFQMFGWTLVAVVVYIVIFLGNLSNELDALPTVDPTIVTLMGVSQTGYLGGKAASNLTK